MICSIHQPNYIPYLGLFQKIYKSDIFIFYDTAQYTKGDYHNRNKIKGPNGEILLSLPVNVSLGDTICDVKINPKILKKHLKTIEQSYKKSQYFEEVFKLLSEIYSYDGDKLSDFNIQCIKKISKYIGCETKFYSLSETKYNLESSGTQALIDICKEFKVSKYISGAGGKGYVEKTSFKDANIELEFQDFDHPVYKQLWSDFIPYMSIIDLLFNEGPNSIVYIK